MRRFALGMMLAMSLSAGAARGQAVAGASARAVIITQLQAQLQAFQGAGDAARPALALQIADAYVALAAAALADKLAAQAQGPKQQPLANQMEQVVVAAHKRAITFYSLVLTEHPTFAQNDVVRLRLAREYEQAGDRKSSRATYEDLIKKHASSPHVPNAHLALGEYYFEEAINDPSKMDLAARAYGEAVKYPPPANGAFGYAWYRLAFVYWNKGETAKARHAFQQVIDFGASYPQISGATPLAKAARIDLAALPP